MLNRNLDNIYVRVERDGEWQTISLSDTTIQERHQILENKSPRYLISCIDLLCESIQDIGKQLDIVGDKNE